MGAFPISTEARGGEPPVTRVGGIPAPPAFASALSVAMSESVRVMVLGKVTLQLAPLGHGNGLWAYPGGGIRVADPPVTAVPLLDTAACGVTPGQYWLVLEALIVALPLI